MGKLKKLLADILLKFDFILLGWAAKLDPPSKKEYKAPPPHHILLLPLKMVWLVQIIVQDMMLHLN
jgi:hypothetical protein